MPAKTPMWSGCKDIFRPEQSTNSFDLNSPQFRLVTRALSIASCRFSFPLEFISLREEVFRNWETLGAGRCMADHWLVRDPFQPPSAEV